MAFSIVLSFCSAYKLSSVLQVWTAHIPRTQRAQKRAKLQSVITVKLFLSFWLILEELKQHETHGWTDRIPV